MQIDTTEAHTSDQRGKRAPSWIVIIIIVSFAAVILLWLGYPAIVAALHSELSDGAKYGDMFGGLNALFSGLAFAAVIGTLLLQREELALQRQELAETRQELRRTADAQERSQMILAEQADYLKRAATLTALVARMDGLNKHIEGLLRLPDSATRDTVLSDFGQKLNLLTECLEFEIRPYVQQTEVRRQQSLQERR